MCITYLHFHCSSITSNRHCSANAIAQTNSYHSLFLNTMTQNHKNGREDSTTLPSSFFTLSSRSNDLDDIFSSSLHMMLPFSQSSTGVGSRLQTTVDLIDAALRVVEGNDNGNNYNPKSSSIARRRPSGGPKKQ